MKPLPFGNALVALSIVASVLAPAAGAQPAAPDVLVVGGTPAGVAAAVAAARDGARVELVARRPELGGVLTDSMMDQWDLNLAPGGASVEGGIFSEIYARLGDSFTPAQAARVFRQLVAREPRITLVTDATPVSVSVSGDAAHRAITSVAFRDAHGDRFSVNATDVIDATDDGDVAALAGAPFDLGRQDTGIDERMQPVTLMFTVTGVDWPALAARYDSAVDGPGGATERRAWGYGDLMRRYRTLSPMVLVRDLNLGHEDGGAVTVNAIDVLGIDALNESDDVRARALAETEAPRLVAWLRGELPGFADAHIGRYADALYVRETRHFAGRERLTAGDVWDGRIPADTIGLSSYPLDLHPLTATDPPAYAPIRHVYGIPLGALLPRGFTNLVLASPAISASHLASGSARVIPTTIEEGQAAGTAAALAIARHETLATIDEAPAAIAAMRADLTRAGAILAVRA